MFERLHAPALITALFLATAASAGEPARSSSGAPDAGTSAAAADGEATRIAEVRGAVPPLLLFGRLRPEVGTFVEYELTSGSRKSPVRVAVTGRVVKAGVPMHQVEFDFVASPRTVVVAYVTEAERPAIDRLVLWIPPQAPVSVPVDLPLDRPELRGPQAGQPEPAKIASGAFAGAGQRVRYKPAEGAVEVIESEKVPLFGIASLRMPKETWVAKKTGTGAVTVLTAVPIVVPRFNQ